MIGSVQLMLIFLVVSSSQQQGYPPGFGVQEGYPPGIPVQEGYSPRIPVQEGYSPRIPVQEGYSPRIPVQDGLVQGAEDQGGNGYNERFEVQDDNGQSHIIFPAIRQERQDSLAFGSCRVILARDCPHPDVQFFLYTREHGDVPEPLEIGIGVAESNITKTSYNSSMPTKILVHGYNSDMNINALVEIKNQYLYNDNYNVIAVDWSPLAPGPCYPAAVWNTRFAGHCSSYLVKRLREVGAQDIHVIGFSLGAHVAAFMANHLNPYKLPRITGLDPALPGFASVDPVAKLDESDAEFVDVIHTNIFLQGQVARCGHVDFYVNGGVQQPGCWADNRVFACNHHRSAFYFAETINSPRGFYGWPCINYVAYVIGKCPPQEPQILMGEYVDYNARGMYLTITNSVPPFAVGKFDGPTTEILFRQYEVSRASDLERYRQVMQSCQERNPDREEVDDEDDRPVGVLPPGTVIDVELTPDAYDHVII